MVRHIYMTLPCVEPTHTWAQCKDCQPWVMMQQPYAASQAVQGTVLCFVVQHSTVTTYAPSYASLGQQSGATARQLDSADLNAILCQTASTLAHDALQVRFKQQSSAKWAVKASAEMSVVLCQPGQILPLDVQGQSQACNVLLTASNWMLSEKENLAMLLCLL